MRNDFDDVVAMTFVERNCGGVIDGGLEANGVAVRRTQAVLGALEQGRADVAASSLGANVDGDDVSHATTAAFSNNEGKN